VGNLVRHCVDQGKEVTGLRVEELKRFSQAFEDDVPTILTAGRSVDSRRSEGGTATAEVDKAIARAERELEGGGS
jgi:argininosuccinate lyase